MSGAIWGTPLQTVSGSGGDTEHSLMIIDPLVAPIPHARTARAYNSSGTDSQEYFFSDSIGQMTLGLAAADKIWHIYASEYSDAQMKAWKNNKFFYSHELTSSFTYFGKTVYYEWYNGATFGSSVTAEPCCKYKDRNYLTMTDDLAKYIAWLIVYGVPEGNVSYAQKPFNLNILNGDVWNFIAVEPGAWFYSVYDDHKTHHMYFLAGNEFKLLEFQDADSNGEIPHKEYHSTPITINGKQYHSLYLSRTVDSVCPFPTAYYKLSELPSDEKFYTELTDYVLNFVPYDRGDVLGLLALRNLLSANSGDVNVDLDDLKAMLKGYTVEERQNPYLDDPNLDATGHPTVSFHD